MNTLVIHPDDRSTDFLKPIYKNITATVITGGISKSDVLKMIYEHDRTIMMGHGSPWGLFSLGKFLDSGSYIIDNDMVHILLQKKENIFIWCNADQFVKRHQLKGFYSGMFISETSEANYCGLPGTPQKVVTESNDSFAQLLGEVANLSVRDAYKHVSSKYKILAESNSVANYNSQRLYLN
jgi:hypothetical protein